MRSSRRASRGVIQIQASPSARSLRNLFISAPIRVLCWEQHRPPADASPHSGARSAGAPRDHPNASRDALDAWRHYSADVDTGAVADYLEESPLFACLSPEDRLALAGKMRPRHFARDEVIFHSDDPAGHVFLITSGTVKVSVPDEQGREVVVPLERGGDVFGELALFDDSPRSATVTAITETHTLALSRHEFIAVLERNPDATRRMLALLVTP